jgi:hypothetical protein
MNLRRGVPTRTLAAVGVLAAVACSTLGVQHASAQATGTMVATVRSFANPTKVGDPGNPDRDNLYVYNSAAVGPHALEPTGKVTFFLCQPSEVTSAGCPTGGERINSDTTRKGLLVHSDQVQGHGTRTVGTYCWRVEYSGDRNFAPVVDTNATTECFTVANLH